ncbi:hypothetical protein [Brevibacillus sp. HB1.3]|uniref:hypothetical protein n=1 Tax=Brevibacillus sp. HB1.3 TaxID=2738842 RepID=UPI0020A6B3CA|nr:hypothetical protein [Brevibacillus sp. HB1.3]
MKSLTRHNDDQVTIRFARIEDAASLLSMQRDVFCEGELAGIVVVRISGSEAFVSYRFDHNDDPESSQK